MDAKVLGARIRDARNMAKLTSDKTAELCNCSPVSIRQIECGERLPSVPKLVRICNIFKVSPTYLLLPELTFMQDDIVDVGVDEQIKNITQRLCRLSKTELDIVCSTLETLLDHLT